LGLLLPSRRCRVCLAKCIGMCSLPSFSKVTQSLDIPIYLSLATSHPPVRESQSLPKHIEIELKLMSRSPLSILYRSHMTPDYRLIYPVFSQYRLLCYHKPRPFPPQAASTLSGMYVNSHKSGSGRSSNVSDNVHVTSFNFSHRSWMKTPPLRPLSLKPPVFSNSSSATFFPFDGWAQKSWMKVEWLLRTSGSL